MVEEISLIVIFRTVFAKFVLFISRNFAFIVYFSRYLKVFR
jgi:hypothetical protein